MELLDIIILILLSITLIVLVILLVIYLKNNNSVTAPEVDLKPILGLEKSIEFLPTQFKSEIKLAVSESTIKLQEQVSKNSETNNEKLERFQNNISESLNKRFDALNKQMDDKLAAINKKVDEKLSEGFKGTSETIAQVRERLQAIDNAQKNLEGLSKEVVSLKNVLEGNQTRGAYGEYQLSMILNNIFGNAPGCYEEQYTIKKHKTDSEKDVRADAVVFMPEPNKMICIDSKFPFQDYRRMFEEESEEIKETLKKEFGMAVKKHITAIKDKYIIEGKTAQEAIIFIPNDGVFAFIHSDLPEVVEYARSVSVILTSPSTLPAILVTINMVRIEVERAKNANEISRHLEKLGKDFEMFAREWESFSRQLDTATKTREKLDSRVNKINMKFDNIKVSSLDYEEKEQIEELPEIE
jgi:DNA recombination protein RmuC